jgi:ATP-dependent RNA helicase RhlE
VLAALPRRRQSLLFTATLPPEAEGLAKALLSDPVRVQVETQLTEAPAIAQRSIVVDANRRTQLLKHILLGEAGSQQPLTRVMVFVATQYAARTVAEKLRRGGVRAAPFSADLAQATRQQVLRDFHSGHWHVLVCTDLAARGIDIPALSLVVNYDLARSADDHTHRIGRTARAGAPGQAISLVSPGTQAHMRQLEKRLGLQLPRETIAGFEPSEPLDAGVGDQAAAGTGTGLDPMGGIKGKRPSKKDKLRAAAAMAAAKKGA